MKRLQSNKSHSKLNSQLDWFITLIPLFSILALCLLFVLSPERSGIILSSIRFFLGDEFGSYYLLIGLGMFLCSLYIAFSKYGSIRLGGLSKPRYSPFQWGSMMFTAGLAADILFYSLCEWILYAGEDRIMQMGGRSGVGLHLSSVSLGADSLGLLSGFGSGFWIYAPCPQAGEAEVFRSMSSPSGKLCGWFCWKVY